MSHACTAFVCGQRVVQAFDFLSDTVRVVYTPVNVKRSSMSLDLIMHDWQVKYASYTFTQFHMNLPQSGMNEKGLVIIGVAQDDAEYPSPVDGINKVNELQFIQYSLDNFSSVSEVVQAIGKTIQISEVAVSMHYLVYDANNQAAVIEGVDGEIRIIGQEEFSLRVLTDTPYREAVADFESAGNFNSKPDIENNSGRFCEVAKALVANAKNIDEIFSSIRIPAGDSLREALQGARFHTRWKVVFDPFNKMIDFAFVNQESRTTYDFADRRPLAPQESISNPEEGNAEFRPANWGDAVVPQWKALLAVVAVWTEEDGPNMALKIVTTTLALTLSHRFVWAGQ